MSQKQRRSIFTDETCTKEEYIKTIFALGIIERGQKPPKGILHFSSIKGISIGTVDDYSTLQEEIDSTSINDPFYGQKIVSLPHFKQKIIPEEGWKLRDIISNFER